MKSFYVAMLGTSLIVCGCRGPGLNNAEAGAANKIEIALGSGGQYAEVEYHIPPERVPQAVRDAMNRLHPGAAFDDAEKEIIAGTTYYELTRTVDGRAVEAMFHADGTLHSEELQVPRNRVPRVVRAAIDSRYPDGEVTSWEEIRDGNRELNEYHVKVERSGKHYKVILSAEGLVTRILREVPAEFEVPVSGR
ncbi:MAG: PepSY-like domain-containing protein [Planctomycetota bacterium]